MFVVAPAAPRFFRGSKLMASFVRCRDGEGRNVHQEPSVFVNGGTNQPPSGDGWQMATRWSQQLAHLGGNAPQVDIRQ